MRALHIQQSATAQAVFAVIACLPALPPPHPALGFLELDRASGRLLYFASLIGCAGWYLLAHGRENAARERLERDRGDAARNQQTKAVKDSEEAADTRHKAAMKQQEQDHAEQMTQMQKHHAAQIEWFKRISNQFVATQRQPSAQPVERAAMHTALSLATSAVTSTATAMPSYTGLTLAPKVPVTMGPEDRARLRRLGEALQQIQKTPPNGPSEQAAASSSLTSLVTSKPEEAPPSFSPSGSLRLAWQEPPKGSKEP